VKTSQALGKPSMRRRLNAATWSACRPRWSRSKQRLQLSHLGHDGYRDLGDGFGSSGTLIQTVQLIDQNHARVLGDTSKRDLESPGSS
jgi:hypothetical protein